MLDGTDLNFAYAPIGNSYQNNQQDVERLLEDETPRTKQVERKSISISRAATPPTQAQPMPQQLSQILGNQQSMPLKQLPSAPMNQPLQQYMFDQQGMNRQFEQEQKINILVNELKRRKNAPVVESDSYIDKLMGKKKELIKFLQSGLIVLFAFSMHFVIDHYLQLYFQNNDVSFEREVFIRMLYPIAIIFIAWNIIAFTK